MRFPIHDDIRWAETLPSAFYRSEEIFQEIKHKVFSTCWHWIGDTKQVPLSETIMPFTLLDGFLTEPLLLTSDKSGNIHCLSNVCTHRGNILAHHAGKYKGLACMYHGRRFDLAGKFISMPEFQQANGFPRECDNLPKLPLKSWKNQLFTSLSPSFALDNFLDSLDEKVGFLPLDQVVHRPELSRDYLVNSHWALYCDNYLEGFHIPFVHSDLNSVLDYGSYKTELYDSYTIQIGYASSGEEVFDLPVGHVDYGRSVAAYYFWLFPNLMLNFYPWGISINVVKPLQINKTKVSFITYVLDEAKLGVGAGALLDKVEREDEFVVEGVHKGLQSALYKAGRFSPTREQGVHHFHKLLSKHLG